MSIPGIGPLSAAVFLGELGDPAHFHNARQIVKYAGYDPQESDSGSRIGRKFISKKGRWLLRKYLFFMSMRVVVLSNYFQEYYLRKLETKNRVGQQPRRKEMLCAVAIKLIKVIFACCGISEGLKIHAALHGTLTGSMKAKRGCGGRRTVLLRRLEGLHDSAWSTSTTLFVLHKVSWA